jgi:ankyrin repeat protein
LGKTGLNVVTESLSQSQFRAVDRGNGKEERKSSNRCNCKKIMKWIDLNILLFITLNSCTMATPQYGRQFRPDMYFTGNDLHIAQSIYNGDTALIYQIPQSEINTINEKGICWLIYSIYAYNERAMEILLERGADPNIYCEIRPKPSEFQENQTPISNAAGWPESFTFVKTLLKYGANPNDNRATPALFRAIMRNDRLLVDLLLDNGADVNIQYNKITKDNALLDAYCIFDFDMVNHLLDRGANPMLRDVEGICLAYKVQQDFDSGEGDKNYRKIISDLKKRLEGMGVVFPVEKIPPKEGEDPVSEYRPETPPPVSTPPSASLAPQAQNSQKKKWTILFDDDDFIIG